VGPIQEASSYFSFGGAFTFVEIANTVCKHIDNLLIGKVWGMELLGQYTRAYALMLAPLNQVMGPIGAVLIPSFSRIHQNETEFEKLTMALFVIFVGLTAPIAAFFLVCSNPIVDLLLGSGWEQAQKIFWWFGFAVFCKPLGCHIYWIFISCGRMKQMMRWTAVNTLLTVSAVLIGLLYGPICVAKIFSISEITVQIPLAIWFLGKTKLIRTAKWYKVYIFGLGLFGGSYYILQSIQVKLGEYALSANTELGILSCVTVTLSAGTILAIPECRYFLKSCYKSFL
jgi:O-antigen/teichoic acid export membrane protein